MNLQELENSFRTDADDAVEPYLWSSDEVIGWLNEAQEEACIRSRLIHEKTDPAICEIEISAADGSEYQLHELVTEIVYASITDSSDETCRLNITDREELDRLRPDWRTESQKPTGLIHHDTTIEMDSVVDGDYTVSLEVYRLPRKPMVKEGDCPEIARSHHKHLVQWALHRAYEKPDAETLNPQKSAISLDKFEKYFGFRPDAKMRKDENANRPHVNKGYW